MQYGRLSQFQLSDGSTSSSSSSGFVQVSALDSLASYHHHQRRDSSEPELDVVEPDSQGTEVPECEVGQQELVHVDHVDEPVKPDDPEVGDPDLTNDGCLQHPADDEKQPQEEDKDDGPGKLTSSFRKPYSI